MAIAVAMSTIPHALAQTSAAPTSAAQGAAAQGAAAPSGYGQEITPTGEYQAGLPLGAWMLYPELFVGAVWDSNANQASSNQAAQTATGSSPDSGTSLAVSPRLVATTSDGGMHSSTLYGVGDFQFFNSNTVAATAGFIHTYKPTEDLAFNLNLNYTRQTDLFTSSLNFNNNAIGLQGGPAIPSPTIINPFGTTPTINPVAYNQYTAGGSVSKTWDTWFTTLTGNFFAIDYDHANNVPAPFNTSQDAIAVWADGKVGWHFVPSLYVYGDVAGIWQGFTNSAFNTNGYRVTGGLGTDDPNSLVRGEVYGGYQFQHQEFADCARAEHLARRTEQCVWRPDVLFPDPVLDVGSIGRRGAGNVGDARTQHSAGCANPGHHRDLADDLWPVAAMVARRPCRLHAGQLFRHRQDRYWLDGGRLVQL